MSSHICWVWVRILAEYESTHNVVIYLVQPGSCSESLIRTIDGTQYWFQLRMVRLLGTWTPYPVWHQDHYYFIFVNEYKCQVSDLPWLECNPDWDLGCQQFGCMGSGILTSILIGDVEKQSYHPLPWIVKQDRDAYYSAAMLWWVWIRVGYSASPQYTNIQRPGEGDVKMESLTAWFVLLRFPIRNLHNTNWKTIIREAPADTPPWTIENP